VAVEPDRGLIKTVELDEDVKQSINIILSTSKGERVMRPDFGCGIHDLVFGAIDTALITDVKENVLDALRRFEARIDVLSVEVDAEGAAEGRLIISIDYQIRTTNQAGNFVYPFYFKEAS